MSPSSVQKRLPVILLIAIGAVLTGLLIYAFTLKPQAETASSLILSAETPSHEAAILRTAVPETLVPEPTVTPIPAEETSEPAPELSAPFWSEGVLWRSDTYRSPTLSVTVSAHTDTVNFSRRVVYYVADIVVSDVTQIRTASVYDDFARTGHTKVKRMAQKHDALVAISGDYCGCHRNTLIIRNGIPYREKFGGDDVCLLLRTGEMETITRGKVNLKSILAKDPWQAWEFGPALLDSDGTPRRSVVNDSLNPKNPRSCIGYFEPGHYCFVVADGRQKNSHGLTLVELARLMQSLGCKQAFNLDGGASAHFYWKDKIFNKPSGGGREISDIIYVAKEEYPSSRYFFGKAGSAR